MEMEKQTKYLASIFYGCSDKEVRRSFQFAEKNGINHNFNTELKMANWLVAFLKRNHISVRKAEATSLNRITAFNKKEVDRFFELLQQVMENTIFCPETSTMLMRLEFPLFRNQEKFWRQKVRGGWAR